ncbi:MAG TPA: hypothetical protein VMO88_04505, partial [Acidimicrobiales bacterium]|nr:hypothetical protein [Acidimicrobiales bacterium]
VVVAAFLVLRSGMQPHVAAATILGVVLLVASPVQPWYGVVLAGLGVLAGAPWLTLPALLAEPYYAAVILGSRHQIGIGQLCYGAAAFVLLIALLIRQRSAQRVRIGAISSTRL